MKQKKDEIKIEDLDVNEVGKIENRLKSLSAGDVISKEDEKLFKTAAKLLSTLMTIYSLWKKSKGKIHKLLKMIFGNSSERRNPKKNNETKDSSAGEKGKDEIPPLDTQMNSQNSDEEKGIEEEKKSENNNSSSDNEEKRKGGTGRNGVDQYEGAAEIECFLPEHQQPGKICPKCKRNKLYEVDPKKVIRLIGNAPVTCFKYIQQKTKCICGAIFIADVGDDHRDIYNQNKYSPSALAAMVIYKYIMGVSFGSLASLQASKGVPLPASTQSNKIKNEILPIIQILLSVLKEFLANAGMLGYDDTTIRVLQKRLTKDQKSQTHRGHGTAVVGNFIDHEENQILYFDFNPSLHAGDVIIDLLSSRTTESLPLLVSDGLISYEESKKKGLGVGCNSHARRKVIEEDPEEKTYVGKTILDSFGTIYQNEKEIKEKGLCPEERLLFHQEKSAPLFERIETIFSIIDGRNVSSLKREEHSIPDFLVEDEPNGTVRKVAQYFLNRSEELTAVLRIPNAPLDTNYVERVIKAIIKIRRNSLFFNNAASAEYSGEILTLLKTAETNGVSMFEYIDYLITHKEEVMKNPKNYLPWLYLRDNLEKEYYWQEYEKFKKSPSNFLEFSPSQGHRSSA